VNAAVPVHLVDISAFRSPLNEMNFCESNHETGNVKEAQIGSGQAKWLKLFFPGT
jgi:hypothetical protein